MQTFKVSHSILSNWRAGRFEEAVGMYLGKDLPATPAMELGSLYDKKWTAEIEKTGCMPLELGGEPLDNPRTQTKYQLVLPFSEEYQMLLRGVLDIDEPKRITDLKCGRTTATGYMKNGVTQLDYYSLFKKDATEGHFVCFNPYTMDVTRGIKFFDHKTREGAIEDILTYGGEMLDYLLSNRLFKNYEGV